MSCTGAVLNSWPAGAHRAQLARLPCPLFHPSCRASFCRAKEQSTNIMPRYAGPLALLLPDDVLTVACLVCDPHAHIEVRSLPRHIRSGFTVEMLEACLCCTSCGERGSVELVAIEAKGD